MKSYHGIKGLLDSFDEIPESGWISIKEAFSEQDDTEALTFYIAENIEEKIDLEDNYDGFLEAPTFKDIVTNKQDHNPNVTLNEIIHAVNYYFEHDDFED